VFGAGVTNGTVGIGENNVGANSIIRKFLPLPAKYCVYTHTHTQTHTNRAFRFLRLTLFLAS